MEMPSSSQPSQPRAWQPYLTILATALFGLLFTLNAPLWFKPPYVEATSLLYALLFFAWIPMFIIQRRKHPRVNLTMLIVVVGTLGSCCTCAVIAPTSNATWGLGVLDNTTCQEVEVEGNRVRYDCLREAFDGPEFNQQMTLEGYDWLPFLWRVRD
jgi:hypothetical protein